MIVECLKCNFWVKLVYFVSTSFVVIDENVFNICCWADYWVFVAIGKHKSGVLYYMLQLMGEKCKIYYLWSRGQRLGFRFFAVEVRWPVLLVKFWRSCKWIPKICWYKFLLFVYPMGRSCKCTFLPLQWGQHKCFDTTIILTRAEQKKLVPARYCFHSYRGRLLQKQPNALGQHKSHYTKEGNTVYRDVGWNLVTGPDGNRAFRGKNFTC